VTTRPFDIDDCAGFDCLANKGILMLRVVIPGLPTPVEIVTTHLNSKRSARVTAERSLYAHNRQFDDFADFLAANRRPEEPLIVGGDFNMRHAQARFDYATARRPMQWVNVWCVDKAKGCDVRASWDGDAPWMDTEDLQAFEDGRGIAIRPIAVEALFDKPIDGARLSDHDALLVRYRLTWKPIPAALLAADEER
jgi:hypothetical protein